MNCNLMEITTKSEFVYADYGGKANQAIMKWWPPLHISWWKSNSLTSFLITTQTKSKIKEDNKFFKTPYIFVFAFTYFLSCQMQGDAIHDILSKIDYPFVYEKLKQGEVYSIFNIFVRRSQHNYKVVNSLIQAHFNARTLFVPLQNSLPQISEHRFYFLDYNQLPKHISDNTLLKGKSTNSLYMMVCYA